MFAIAAASCCTPPRIEPPPRLPISSLEDDEAHIKVCAHIGQLLDRHGYVLLEGLSDMTAEQMCKLMSQVAGPQHAMLRFDEHCVLGTPEVRVLGCGHARALTADIGYEWHQDGGGTAPFLTLLHCKEPCAGADTLFADGAVCFHRLSPADQHRARSLTAVYSNLFTAGGPTALDAACGLRMSPCGTRRIRGAAHRKEGWVVGRFRRPLVEVACTDGQERLLAGAKGLEHFEGMGVEESALELSRLLRAALAPTKEGEVDGDLRTLGKTRFAEEAVYVHHWRPGEALLFDNHRMMHSTVPLAHYEAAASRLMWQIICRTQPASADAVKHHPMRAAGCIALA